jgi:hypothetical protein
VQIAESVGGRRRIVRHRDEAELGLLMEEARRLLEDDRQGVLDLGITPQARRSRWSRPGAAGVVRRRAGSRGPAGGAAGADAEDGLGLAV